jgi:hypothetical protein
MNAYELAEIMTTHDGSQVWEHGLEIANMLRQQADDVNLWKEQYLFINSRCSDLEKQIRQQADRIAELEGLYWKEIYKNIPPQTKPLSDEEIYEIWRTCPCSPDDIECFARAIEAKVRGEK